MTSSYILTVITEHVADGFGVGEDPDCRRAVWQVSTGGLGIRRQIRPCLQWMASYWDKLGRDWWHVTSSSRTGIYGNGLATVERRGSVTRTWFESHQEDNSESLKFVTIQGTIHYKTYSLYILLGR